MKNLILPMKKKWHDMIDSMGKGEEYREIKDYWEKRLIEKDSEGREQFKVWDTVTSRNGYAKDAPMTTRECLGVRVDYGKVEWGAEEGVLYFVISLGEKVNGGNECG